MAVIFFVKKLMMIQSARVVSNGLIAVMSVLNLDWME